MLSIIIDVDLWARDSGSTFSRITLRWWKQKEKSKASIITIPGEEKSLFAITHLLLTNINSETQGQWRLRNECIFSIQKYFHVTCLQKTRILGERLDRTSETGDLRLNIQKLMMKEHYCEAPLGWGGKPSEDSWCVSLYKKKVEGKEVTLWSAGKK